MDAKRIEMHLIVHGLVQGVGYRATVAHHARRLELAGTVKNLDDGSVEIFVQGEQEKVALFSKLIVEQVAPADVQKVAAQEVASPHSYQGFKIAY